MKQAGAKKLVIVGAGASGLAAAVTAARAGASVTLLERNRQVGKKLLVTGNGRCNLTNVDQDLSHYRGSDPAFAQQVLEARSMSDTVRFFTELGIFTKNRKGYLYPYSDQALAVAEALRMEAEHLGVLLKLDTKVLAVKRTDNGRFLAETKGWTYEADAVILAAGSAAAPETGSDGSGYELSKMLGHRVIKPLPALVQLHCREKFLEKTAGLRMDASVALFSEGRLLASDQGEVQFTKTGISGIPVFQVSRWGVRALDAGKEVCAVLNLLPLFSKEQLLSFLEQRRECSGYKTGKQFLVGLFPEKLIPVLLERAKAPKEKPVGDWRKEEFASLAQVIGGFSLTLRGFGSFSQAQVCSGGVDTASVNGKTMESRLVPGLYFAGELLDIDGACGGYNLQWAWSTGALAGRFAAERVTG